MDLDELLSIEHRADHQGLARGARAALQLDEIGQQGWSLRNQDLALPALVLRRQRDPAQQPLDAGVPGTP